MSTVKVTVAAFILLNILYLSLSLYQFVQSIKALKRIRFGSMFAILVGDGVLYFIGCVALNAVDMLFTGNIPSLFPYVDVLQFWLCGEDHVIFLADLFNNSSQGCHLILHLRSANNSLTSLTTFMDCADMDVRYFEPSTDDEGVDLGEIKSRA
ncbi:hypothetical protein NLJ89_g1631 [Agrocybe chaxingu]|uniref:Uncharacterized protein n=1 Tax=Agrocybe chaxingu TaxID=84603 RepID=A0A9W8MZM3_9AGAR|nr:hypothetical protein NLJ89_g1631 [Agrocybe chaxingu]